MTDLWPLALSGLYVVGLVLLAEHLRRSGRLSFEWTRKLLHVGIGTWILPTVLIFQSGLWAAIGPAVFTMVNIVSRRRVWIRAMEEESGSNRGAVYMPLAFLALIFWLWDRDGGRAVIAGSLLALAWGDAAAALIGRRFGRHRYRAGDEERSFEGSAAMFAFSLLGIWVGFAVTDIPVSLALVVLGATAATLLEAVGRRGLDNLLVPLGTAAVLQGFARHF